MTACMQQDTTLGWAGTCLDHFSLAGGVRICAAGEDSGSDPTSSFYFIIPQHHRLLPQRFRNQRWEQGPDDLLCATRWRSRVTQTCQTLMRSPVPPEGTKQPSRRILDSSQQKQPLAQ